MFPCHIPVDEEQSSLPRIVTLMRCSTSGDVPSTATPPEVVRVTPHPITVRLPPASGTFLRLFIRTHGTVADEPYSFARAKSFIMTLPNSGWATCLSTRR